MKKQIKLILPIPALALIIVSVFLYAGCGITLPGMSPKVLPYVAPPEGVFPAQFGNLKLNAAPTQSDYSTAELRSYAAYYTSPQKSEVTYNLSIYSAAQIKPEEVPYGWELLNDSGATKVYFGVGLERIFIRVKGDKTFFSAQALNIADANEVIKNIPYQALNAAPPAAPFTVELPPPSANPKPQPDAKTPSGKAPTKESPELTKTLDEVNKSLRELTLAAVKLWASKNGAGNANPQINKLDPTTLMVNAGSVKTADVSNMAAKLKKDLGKNLKEIGFRQFVFYPDVVKLD